MTSTGFADTTLKSASRFWVVVAVAGQLIFAFYVAILYGRGAVRGDWISLNTVMPHGYVPADTMGNFAVVLHLLSAFVILAGHEGERSLDMRQHFGHLTDTRGSRGIEPERERWRLLPVQVSTVALAG